MEVVLVLCILVITYVIYKIWDAIEYEKTINKYNFRIHVTGIRGKSSTTRLIGAVLQGYGIKTVIKTTGSAARIIEHDGHEFSIPRKEANILEQRKYIEEYAKRGYKAAVFECMAIKPDYIEYLEKQIMKSNIYIITNIRTDHTDELGGTLEEIAQSFARTIPPHSTVITAEDNDTLFEILKKACEKKHAKIVRAQKDIVPDEIMEKFNYIEFKENVAIALEVAKLVGIPTQQALQYVIQAKPDPGALKIDHLIVDDKEISFVHAFAANDIESFTKIVDLINQIYKHKEISDHSICVILNNRKDRPERVALFANKVKEIKEIDYVVTLGDYESEVNKIVKGYKEVINLGNESQFKNNSGKELLSKIASYAKNLKLVIIGAVNIHTHQADKIREFIHETLHAQAHHRRKPLTSKYEQNLSKSSNSDSKTTITSFKQPHQINNQRNLEMEI